MNLNMNNFKIGVAIIIAIVAVFFLINKFSCGLLGCSSIKTHDSSHGTTTSQTETHIAQGKPDTTTNKIAVSGKSVLRKDALRASLIADSSQGVPPVIGSSVVESTRSSGSYRDDTYSGAIQDSTFNLIVTAKLDTATGTLNLEYEGSVLQKTVSRVDTLFSNTVNTIVEETPWFKTVYAGAAYATTIIITIIYLLVR